MKTTYPIIIIFVLLISVITAKSQMFLDGDFDHVTLGPVCFEENNASFNNAITYTRAFGAKNSPKLYSDFCNIIPQSGKWCVGLTANSSSSDAIGTGISGTLKVGESYTVEFYNYGYSDATHDIRNLQIGITTNDHSFGTLVYTGLPSTNSWGKKTITFTATVPAIGISVMIKNEFSVNPSCIFIDNFKISKSTGTTAIAEQTNEVDINVYPNPFTEHAIVSLPKNINTSEATFNLFDLSGKEHSIIYDVNNNQIILQRGSLPSGIYFFTIQIDDKFLTTGKIMIQ